MPNSLYNRYKKLSQYNLKDKLDELTEDTPQECIPTLNKGFKLGVSYGVKSGRKQGFYLSQKLKRRVTPPIRYQPENFHEKRKKRKIKGKGIADSLKWFFHRIHSLVNPLGALDYE